MRMTNDVFDESDKMLDAYLDALRVPESVGSDAEICAFVKTRSCDGFMVSFARIAAVAAVFCALSGFYVGYAHRADAGTLTSSSLGGYLTDLFDSAPYTMEL